MINKNVLHMNKPIWVWCYLMTESKQESHRNDMPPLSVWPNAHTYAFLTEAEALAHPAAVGWNKIHGYKLQKVYLQEGNNNAR